ncbi:MAG TPA: hypothetical protein V6C76_12980 [Drouetiella sp.]
MLSVITDQHPNACYDKPSLAKFTNVMQDPREVVIGFSILGPGWQNNGRVYPKPTMSGWITEPKSFDDDFKKAGYCEYFGARYPILHVVGPVRFQYTGLTRTLCVQAEGNLRDVAANGWSNLLDPDPYLRTAINALASEFGSYDLDTRVHGNIARYGVTVDMKKKQKDLADWVAAWNAFPLVGIPWPTYPGWEKHLGPRVSQTELGNR